MLCIKVNKNYNYKKIIKYIYNVLFYIKNIYLKTNIVVNIIHHKIKIQSNIKLIYGRGINFYY
jgi:hypothetical protein